MDDGKAKYPLLIAGILYIPYLALVCCFVFANDAVTTFVSDWFPNSYIIIFVALYIVLILLPIIGLLLCRTAKKCGADGNLEKAMEIAYALLLGLTFGVLGILVIILLIGMIYRNHRKQTNKY